MVFSEVKKVVKFGGTSLANAAQFVKCAEIIKSEKSRKYVVPSAPGKRFPEDTKITDMLIKCYELSAKKEDFSGLFNDIKDRYNSIIRELSLYKSGRRIQNHRGSNPKRRNA